MLIIKVLAECDKCGVIETEHPIVSDDECWPRSGNLKIHRYTSHIKLPKGWKADEEGNITCPTCLEATADLPCLLEQQQRFESASCMGERLQAYCPAQHS